ncbi:MAG: IS1 transposase [Chloroflexota bacterium]
MQRIVEQAPPAAFYFSDLFVSYRSLVYTPRHYTPMPDQSETDRVEGMNAELRHHWERLVRKSHCSSCCIEALQWAVKLFVFAWNRRQLYRLRFPPYPAHLIHFRCS